MPFYDYDCPRCGLLEARRSIAERDDELACPHCGERCPRLLNTKAASVGGSAGNGDDAEGTYGMRHRSGCLCCR
ncbi:zinc ribbon domain-containing protein [Paraburkholderia sp. CNPSo 3272]|uniref:zinc ribbon domain-containing protein n=1 Tax=Paraburkholderia sp. CNPSo 3272 TaxID=2940931 RepID=UPI0020B88726|nr:zinc ribbon domain-containing protein [Paraburkholderia sp. CNPSo 3272]MCP3722948.1 zinc ribbon domain-containing protein [Paraburkholderia sp. CNPSo 3272]